MCTPIDKLNILACDCRLKQLKAKLRVQKKNLYKISSNKRIAEKEEKLKKKRKKLFY